LHCAKATEMWIVLVTCLLAAGELQAGDCDYTCQGMPVSYLDWVWAWPPIEPRTGTMRQGTRVARSRLAVVPTLSMHAVPQFTNWDIWVESHDRWPRFEF
jgi:hypothetical protein